MKRKFSITVIIFFSAFMLNVSAMAFQQRYDRREDDEDYDPHVIEMIDQHVFKYLKNTWFFDLPLRESTVEVAKDFFIEEIGFGTDHMIVFKPFLCCQLKFLLVDYIGFFIHKLPPNTLVERSLFLGVT
jgi:hypothetical protein